MGPMCLVWYFQSKGTKLTLVLDKIKILSRVWTISVNEGLLEGLCSQQSDIKLYLQENGTLQFNSFNKDSHMLLFSNMIIISLLGGLTIKNCCSTAYQELLLCPLHNHHHEFARINISVPVTTLPLATMLRNSTSYYLLNICTITVAVTKDWHLDMINHW